VPSLPSPLGLGTFFSPSIHDVVAGTSRGVHPRPCDDPATRRHRDVADGRGCVDTSCRLLQDARVIVVAGNHDRWLLADRVRHVPEAHRVAELDAGSVAYIKTLPRTVELQTVAGRLLLCHGVARNDLGKVWPGTPRSRIERDSRLDELLAEGHFRFVVNGHLHYRVLIDFPGMLLMNAGALKGPFAGVSIMDFSADCVSAWAFDANDRPSRTAEHSLSPVAGRRVWRDTQEFDGTWEPLALHA
jgi:predicted phosphodiesterase